MCHVTNDEDKFADNLIVFVMDEYMTKQRFNRNLKQCRTSSPFTGAIKFAVRKILEENDVEIRNIFNSLLGYGNLKDNFKDFLTTATNAFILRGYNEKEFIEFCAFTAKLATFCYTNGFRDGILLEETTIVELVKHFKRSGEFTSEGWNKLNQAIQVQLFQSLSSLNSKQLSRPNRCCGCASNVANC